MKKASDAAVNLMMMDISISMIASMVMDDAVKRCPAIRLISREEFNIYAVDMTMEFSSKMDYLEDFARTC